MNKSQATREKLCETAIEIAAREGLAAMTLDNVARHAGVSKGGVTYHFPSKDKLLEAVVEHFGERLERLVLERVANDPHPRHRWARAMLDCTFDETPVNATAANDTPANGPSAAEPSANGLTGIKVTRPTSAETSLSGKPLSGKSRSEQGDGSQSTSPVTSRLGVRPADWPDQMLEPLVIERFFLAVLAAATTHPGVIAPLRAVGHRVRERLLADPRDGFDQLLLWLALDGLLLWQFAGLIDRTDPLFAQVGRELRARVDGAFPQSLLSTTAPTPRSTRPDLPRGDPPATEPPLTAASVATGRSAGAAETNQNSVPGRRRKTAAPAVHPPHSDPPAAPARPSRRRNRSS